MKPIRTEDRSRPAMEDPRVHAALGRIADQELRAHAQAALEWMCWDIAAVSDISQLDLQSFLWRDLACKWVMPDQKQRQVPEGYAQLFDQLGMSRFASVCRSATTLAMLDAWHASDGSAAHRMFVREFDRSGVLPPDTESWRWSGVLGMVESRAYEECSRVLEERIASGNILPGSSRWRSAQRAIVDAWLDASGDELFDGDAPRVAVERERLERWLDPRTLTGCAIPTTMRLVVAEMFEEDRRNWFGDDVDAIVDVDRDTRGFVPLRLLIERAAMPSGLRLTERARLGRAVVQEVAERLDWLDWRIGSVRGEDDVPILGRLRELAITLGFVRRRRQALFATPRGRSAIGSTRELGEVTMRELCLASSIEGTVMQLVLAFLLLDGVYERGDLNLQTGRALFDAGWRAGGALDDPLDAEAVEWWLVECLRLLDALGLVTQAGMWPALTYELTQAGRAAAIVGLRACALGPARDPRGMAS